MHYCFSSNRREIFKGNVLRELSASRQLLFDILFSIRKSEIIVVIYYIFTTLRRCFVVHFSLIILERKIATTKPAEELRRTIDAYGGYIEAEQCITYFKTANRIINDMWKNVFGYAVIIPVEKVPAVRTALEFAGTREISVTTEFLFYSS